MWRDVNKIAFFPARKDFIDNMEKPWTASVHRYDDGSASGLAASANASPDIDVLKFRHRYDIPHAQLATGVTFHSPPVEKAVPT